MGTELGSMVTVEFPLWAATRPEKAAAAARTTVE